MKKRSIQKLGAILVTAAVVLSVTACGKETGSDKAGQSRTEVTGMTEEKDAAGEEAAGKADGAQDVTGVQGIDPSMEHVPQVDTQGCDTFTRIVDKLEDGMGYANLNLDGTDLLLVSSGTYDNGDGRNAAIDAEIFAYDTDGSVKYLGYVEAGGTAYPLSDIDGKLLAAGNHFVRSFAVENTELVMVEAVTEVFDTDGKASYFYETGDGVDHSDDPQNDIEAKLNDYYSLLEEAEVIDFQPVGIQAGMGNPWRDSDEEEARSLCPRLFKAPDGAKDVSYRVIDAAGENYGMIEMTFTLDEGYPMTFTARAQAGADEYADISGLYYDWTVTDDCKLANWGEGNMEGKCSRYLGEDEVVDLITWYDIEIGIAYSLTTSGDSPDALDGFDIQAIAEAMYSEENQ